MSNSTKAVTTAFLSNGLISIAKFVGFVISGSSAMLAEAIHSVADTANQGMLLLGMKRSQRKADNEHHFGYGQETYFWNLVSAITIFFIGCVYTVMHATDQLMHHADSKPEVSIVAFVIIGIALAAEGYSWFVAFRMIQSSAEAEEESFIEYIKDTKDPATLAVLVEDTVALLGLLLAMLGMALSVFTGNPMFDSVAAVFIGVLMGFMAVFLAAINRKYLLNKSETEVTDDVVARWKSDPRVQTIHRANSIVISPSESILMAEIELCEEKLSENMSSEEIKGAISFMKRINEIRKDLEREASSEQGVFKKHIFIEFRL